jgi:bifunctional N-acetylglucosamine-1-phosphate-uridyltransferase/glucosamine-1-phosphate-acetyltransferase GlmU-like protein
MNELKEALINLPHVQIVWVDENSNWYFRKPLKIEVVEMKREEVLNYGNVIEENIPEKEQITESKDAKKK